MPRSHRQKGFVNLTVLFLFAASAGYAQTDDQRQEQKNIFQKIGETFDRIKRERSESDRQARDMQERSRQTQDRLKTQSRQLKALPRVDSSDRWEQPEAVERPRSSSSEKDEIDRRMRDIQADARDSRQKADASRQKMRDMSEDFKRSMQDIHRQQNNTRAMMEKNKAMQAQQRRLMEQQQRRR